MKVKTFLFFIFPLALFAQKEDANWFLGQCDTNWDDSTKMDFGTFNMEFANDTFSFTPYCVDFRTGLTLSGVSSNEGELIYFTNGSDVRGKDYEIIENGSNFQPDFVNGFRSMQSTLILPDPLDPQNHFLIQGDLLAYINPVTNQWAAGSQPLTYSYLERQNTTDNGVVVEKKIPINADTLVAGQITATRHANGRDWWILTHKDQSNLFYKFLLNAEFGITEFGSQQIGDPVKGGLGQACFSPDGNWYGIHNLGGPSANEEVTSMNLYQFDRCTGELSNPLTKIFEGPLVRGGVAFSPNSKLMYISNWDKIYQYDLEALNILDTEMVVAEYDGFEDQFENFILPTRFYLMQLTPNDDIIISVSNVSSRYLHLIEKPNVRGLGCNVLQHHIQVPTFYDYVIPNMPYFRSGPVPNSSCDSLSLQANYNYQNTTSLTLQFEDTSQGKPDSWFWDFDDGTTSDEQNPIHTWPDTGDYNVCLTVSKESKEDTFCNTIPLISTGTFTLTESPFINIIPNPTAGNFKIISNERFAIQKLALFDVSGKLLSTLTPTLTIDISNFPAGIYFLKIEDRRGNHHMKKVVKQ